MADARDRAAQTEAGLAVVRVEPRDLIALRLFRPMDEDVLRAGKELGVELAIEAGRWSTGNVRSLRLAPNEWWLDGADMEQLGANLSAFAHHFAAIGHGLACWHLSTRSAEQLLAMGGTLDFSTFAVGSAARTVFAGVPSVITRMDGGTFELVADASHANYLQAWLDSARAGSAG